MSQKNEQSRLERLRTYIGAGDYGAACTEGGKLLEKTLKEIFLQALNAPYKERIQLEQEEIKIAGKEKGVDKFTLGELAQLFQNTDLLKRWARKHEVSNGTIECCAKSLHNLASVRNEAAHDNARSPTKQEAHLFLTYLEALTLALGEVTVAEHRMHGNALSVSGTDVTHRFIGDVNSLADPMRYVIEAQHNRTGQVHVRNIALDMGVSWRIFESLLEKNSDLQNIRFEGMLMNPDAQHVDAVTIPDSWRQTAAVSISRIRGYIEEHHRELERRNVIVAVRKNNSVPLLHGFELSGENLFWGFSRIDGKGRLEGGFDPYMHCTVQEEIGRHYIEVFNSWFDCWWDHAEEL